MESEELSAADQAAEIVNIALWANVNELTVGLDMIRNGETDADWEEMVEIIKELNNNIRIIAGDNDEFYERGRCRLFRLNEGEDKIDYITIMGAEEIEVG